MSTNQELQAFREKFRLDELTCATFGEWLVSVRPEQLTLGSLIVSSEVGVTAFSDLEPEANSGLIEAFSFIEQFARLELGASRVNFICLMMVDPVVHFHALPRFDTEQERFGQTWQDTDWPGSPKFVQRPTADEILIALCKEVSLAHELWRHQHTQKNHDT